MDFRTALRVFLVIGGVVVLGLGVSTESTVRILIGLVAMVLGGFRLWAERAES